MTEPLTLAQRLRDQGMLTVCPFDRRSPDYWTSGENGAPCTVCGQTEDGPNKCTGADLRIMAEAADRIEADAFIIARLRDANKALTAAYERAQTGFDFHASRAERERDRATAAEAKLAKVEAERDTLAMHLKARSILDDKPLFSRRKLQADRDRLSAELAEARKERDRYKAGLQTLATTFYKDDQHQDYASHVLNAKGDDPHAE